jgi:hypothetical protein
MSIQQPGNLAPPIPSDRLTLVNFTAILQRLYGTLFQAAHNHTIVTTVPTSNEGNVGDIYIVQTTSSTHLYAKLASGWTQV